MPSPPTAIIDTTDATTTLVLQTLDPWVRSARIQNTGTVDLYVHTEDTAAARYTVPPYGEVDLPLTEGGGDTQAPLWVSCASGTCPWELLASARP